MNYYNEFDPYAAEWLRNLIAAGHIPAGDVDERSIADVSPADLAGYTQCHFFAGIGGWSRALALAGWPADRPVWTGSCPCQPFSAAGKGEGTADPRHLWPAWFGLIAERRPPVVLGEQVDAAIRHGWLDLVQADLEGCGYAFAAAGIPAAGVGAPHIRQRLWFVADAHDARSQGWRGVSGRADQCAVGAGGVARGMADAERERRGGRERTARRGQHDGANAGRVEGDDGLVGVDEAGAEWLADAERGRAEPQRLDMGSAEDRAGGEARQRQRLRDVAGAGGAVDRPGPPDHFWRDADWLHCRDGKWRPVEPGTFPLAHGIPGRVGRLRAYGNAIVPQVAAEFIEAYLRAA